MRIGWVEGKAEERREGRGRNCKGEGRRGKEPTNPLSKCVRTRGPVI